MSDTENDNENGGGGQKEKPSTSKEILGVQGGRPSKAPERLGYSLLGELAPPSLQGGSTLTGLWRLGSEKRKGMNPETVKSSGSHPRLSEEAIQLESFRKFTESEQMLLDSQNQLDDSMTDLETSRTVLEQLSEWEKAGQLDDQKLKELQDAKIQQTLAKGRMVKAKKNYDLCKKKHESNARLVQMEKEFNSMYLNEISQEKLSITDGKTTHDDAGNGSGSDSDEAEDRQMEKFATILKGAITNASYVSGLGKEEKVLPMFSGSPQEWPLFVNEYKRTTTKYNLQNSENLVRLRRSLKGSARETVLHLLSLPENVPTIITQLELRFGQEKFVLDALVKKVKACPNPIISKVDTIIEFGLAVQALHTNIKNFGREEYMTGVDLLHSIVSKLPPELNREWYLWLYKEGLDENFGSFAKFMEIQLKISYKRAHPILTDWKEEEKSKKKHVGVTVENKRKILFCYYCKSNEHYLSTCSAFAKKPFEEKMKFCRENRCCFSCLKKFHVSTNCMYKKQCGISGCKHYHHRYLHQLKPSGPRREGAMGVTVTASTSIPASTVAVHNNNNNNNSSSGGGGSSSLLHHHINIESHTEEKHNNAALLWYVYVKIRSTTAEKYCIGMIDSGAAISLIDASLAKEIGVSGPSEKLHIGIFNGKELELKTQKVSLQIAAADANAPYYEMRNIYTSSSLDLPKQTVSADKINMALGEKGIHISSQFQAKPQIVIGADNWQLIMPQEIVSIDNDCNALAAMKTRLGWVLVGNNGNGRISQTKNGLYHMQKSDELNEMIKRFICLDNLAINELPSKRSKEDEKALKIIESTTKPVENGYVTGLLWRDKNCIIPESKTMAMKRLSLMEKKMDKDPLFAELVEERFKNLLDKKYLVPVDENSHEGESGRKWWIPWFLVFSPNKKPRLVLDAAAKSGGCSYNTFFLTGPDLILSLFEVLMRFRFHKIALTGDIQEMFHKVKLLPEDMDFQRVLYRGRDRINPPKEYKMAVLIFGSVSSPASANYVKDFNAMKYEKEYPKAVKAITKQTYVDDLLSGGDSVSEVVKLQRDITFIHAQAGFPIVKFSSNSHEVIQSIPSHLREMGNKEISVGEEIPTQKTLGLIWNPTNDCFTFKLNRVKVTEEIPTKRKIASVVMSLFDPLGFIQPLKIRGLLLFQQTWRIGIGWDDEIPNSLFTKWNEWIKDLNEVEEINIDRCLRKDADNNTKYQLHIFCDGSEEAYAAVAYLRYTTENDIKVSFLCGKARVAPLKGITIPRMELSAAVIGARLSHSIKQSFGDDMIFEKEFFYSDSKTVLLWLKSETVKYSQYVTNRVGEILSLTNSENWYYIPSKQNAADDATRLITSPSFHSNCRWLKSSQFLYENENEWNFLTSMSTEEVEEKELERKKIVMITSSTSLLPFPVPKIEDYSCWYNLVHKTAQSIAAFRKIFRKGNAEVTMKDMERAQLLLELQCQQDSFHEEICMLKKGKQVLQKSKLYKLSPGLNEEGVIVLRGRINKAPDILESMKNPIILDPSHHYTKLLIKWKHEMCSHQGLHTVMNELRKRYWILTLRSAVKGVMYRCTFCKIHKAKPIPALMGELPLLKLTSNTPPFHHTALDLFGPLLVKIGRRVEKRWGIVFVCLATKAVYLDVVPSLSSSDLLDCICRFNAKRGPSRHLLSDNGSNLVGADVEIKNLIKQWDQKKMKDQMMRMGIQWTFIPPQSPSYGGQHEVMVGLVKRILKTKLKGKSLKEYTLLTFLAEAENIINSRPLTVPSTDPNDPECITPNHILKLKCIPYNFLPDKYTEPGQGRKMWRTAQWLADQFWDVWRKEYIPTLLPRSKWHKETEPVKVGDVVIAVNDLAERNAWRKAIVTATYRGSDGHVRVVEIKIPVIQEDGTVKFHYFRRHIMKICPTGLNINDGEPCDQGSGREKMLKIK